MLMVLVLRLAVAGVFAAAAAAKLVDAAGTRESLRAFAVPARLAAPAGIVLPLAELCVASLLLPSATARAGAVGAVALLLLFSAVLARGASRGLAAGCNCFVALSSARPRAALLRNVVLGAAAAAVALVGAGQPLTDLSAVEALVLVVAAQAWLNWRLLRLHRIADPEARALDRLEVGSVAPPFALPDATGRYHTLDDLLVPGLPVTLVFSDPDCAGCDLLAARLREAHAHLAGRLTIAVVTRAPGRLPGVRHVLLQEGAEVARAYGVEAVPSAVLVAPDGLVASDAAVGTDAIERLLAPRALRAAS